MMWYCSHREVALRSGPWFPTLGFPTPTIPEGTAARKARSAIGVCWGASPTKRRDITLASQLPLLFVANDFSRTDARAAL
jgi:hypothetical protein